jgi:PAT family beta-lactamase induction signal transducer AmpG
MEGAGARGPADARGEPRRAVWVATTYAAESLPYALVRYLAGVWFTAIGLSEAALGYLNFLGIPWNAKFLWAPFVDLVATRRAWLLGTEAALVAVAFVLAGLVAAAPSPAEAAIAASLAAAGGAAAPVAPTVVLFLLLLAVSALVSATHDVAIDGYYIAAIRDPGEQAAWTGLRVTAYRLAFVFAKSVPVALAAWLAWSWGFLAVAVALAGLLVFHAARLPRVEAVRPAGAPRALLAGFGRAFGSWLAQPRIAVVLPFILTYRLGDEILFSMNTPFLLRALRVTTDQLAWLAGVVGTAGSIVGALLSAAAIRRWGLRRAIWPLTLAMNLNIWAYVWLAWARPDAGTTAGLVTITLVHGYEQMAAGLGHAVLIVFLMRTCRPEYGAAHYAVASALSSLAGTLLGGFGGAVVEAVGYVGLYLIAFAAALPGMALLPFLRLDEPPPGPSEAA